MRKKMLFLFFLFLSSFLFAQKESDCTTISGSVMSFPSITPVEGVKLKLATTYLFFRVYRTLGYTDKESNFSFKMPVDSLGKVPGKRMVKFCKRGYSPTVLILSYSKDHLIYVFEKKPKRQ